MINSLYVRYQYERMKTSLCVKINIRYIFLKFLIIFIEKFLISTFRILHNDFLMITRNNINTLINFILTYNIIVILSLNNLNNLHLIEIKIFLKFLLFKINSHILINLSILTPFHRLLKRIINLNSRPKKHILNLF